MAAASQISPTPRPLYPDRLNQHRHPPIRQMSAAIATAGVPTLSSKKYPAVCTLYQTVAEFSTHSASPSSS